MKITLNLSQDTLHWHEYEKAIRPRPIRTVKQATVSLDEPRPPSRFSSTSFPADVCLRATVRLGRRLRTYVCALACRCFSARAHTYTVARLIWWREWFCQRSELSFLVSVWTESGCTMTRSTVCPSVCLFFYV